MKYPLRRVLVLVLLLLPLTFACSKSEPPKPTPAPTPTVTAPPKPERPAYEIGAIFPLSGNAKGLGTIARNGMELAILDINRSDSPFRFEVTFQDSVGDLTDAIPIMKRMCVTDKLPVIVGEALNHMTLGLAPIATASQTVLISPVSSIADLTTEGGDFFFRTCMSDRVPAQRIAEWMRELGVQSAAVLHTDNPWGAISKDLFVQEFEKAGGSICAVEACQPGEEATAEQVAKLVSSDCDALYLPTLTPEGIAILKSLANLNSTKLVFGSMQWQFPDILQATGVVPDGVRILKMPDFGGAAYDEFHQKYREKYSAEPEWPAVYAYDTVRVLEQAFLAGKRTGPEIRDYLRQMPPYQGLTGTIQFDEHGDRIMSDLKRYKIESGKLVEDAVSETTAASPAEE